MNTDKIARYVWLGRNDRDWYEECEKVFCWFFGSDRLDLVAKLFAAMSINTSLKANIKLFRKALYEIENNKPVGNYLPNIKQQIERIRSGQELSGRKISNFARAMSGDRTAVVVDIWILRAFDLDRKYPRKGKNGKELYRSGGATDGQYNKIETFIKQEARAMTLDPRQLTAMIWAGIRTEKTRDKETRYSTILHSRFSNLFNCI